MLSYLKLLKTRAWARLASFFCLVILLSLILFIVGQKKRHSQIPVIESSDPAVGLPGDVLTITGQHFGSVRGDSYVEISSSRVTGSHCISWQDTEIQLYIPENVQDGLVTVTTGYGTSSPSFFASKANIPVAVRQDPKTTLPVILAVSPETALVGDSITIKYEKYNMNHVTTSKVTEDFVITGFFEGFGLHLPKMLLSSQIDNVVPNYGYHEFSYKLNCDPKDYDRYYEMMDDLYTDDEIRFIRSEDVEEYEMGSYIALLNAMLLIVSIVVVIVVTMLTCMYETIFIDEEVAWH